MVRRLSALLLLSAVACDGGATEPRPQPEQFATDPCHADIKAAIVEYGTPNSGQESGAGGTFTWASVRISFVAHFQTQADPAPDSCTQNITLLT